MVHNLCIGNNWYNMVLYFILNGISFASKSYNFILNACLKLSLKWYVLSLIGKYGLYTIQYDSQLLSRYSALISIILKISREISSQNDFFNLVGNHSRGDSGRQGKNLYICK